MRAKERAYWQAYVRDRVKIDPVTGCWEWQLYCDKDGYGKAAAAYNDYGMDSYAHRLSYTAFKGQIPKGKRLRHQCHNRPCCNPDHLLPGTDQDNVNDAKRDGRCVGPARLTIEQVRAIKLLLARTAYTNKQIAAMFNVHRETIGYIKRGRTWAHV
jgi:hypothetical protein